MPDPLKDKEIVVGVCGGIAAYKAADFVRVLVKSGANARVIMTRAAQAFVGPVTFEALSGHCVWTHMFKGPHNGAFRHIQWAEEADATVIIPATANVLGKMAHGIADDFLSTLMLAAIPEILLSLSIGGVKTVMAMIFSPFRVNAIPLP